MTVFAGKCKLRGKVRAAGGKAGRFSITLREYLASLVGTADFTLFHFLTLLSCRLQVGSEEEVPAAEYDVAALLSRLRYRSVAAATAHLASGWRTGFPSVVPTATCTSRGCTVPSSRFIDPAPATRDAS